MRRIPALLAATLALTTAVGCGGLTTQTFCQRYQQDVLDKLATCLRVPADAKGDLGAAWGLTEPSTCTQMTAAVKGGRATFDAAKAQDCLSLVESLTCADLETADVSACVTAVTGKVADKGACYSDFDCADQGACVVGQNGACPGACIARAAQGGDCSATVCVYGDYCDNNHVCQPFEKQGASCDPTNFGTCAGGLFCEANAQGTSGTCQPFPGQGEACAGGAACQAGLTCGANGTCETIPTVGQSCTTNGYCGYDAYCSSAGTCVENPPVGSACGQQGSANVMCTSSYCKITDTSAYTGVCTAYVADGQTCDASSADGAGCKLSSDCDSHNKCAPSYAAQCQEP